MIRFFTASFPLFWHVFPMDYHGMHPIFWHNFRTMPSQFSNPHPSIFAQPPSQFLNTLWHNFRMAFQIYFSHSLLPTFLACISHGLPRHASHFLAQFSQSTSITNSSIFGTIFAKHIHHKFQHLWHNFRTASFPLFWHVFPMDYHGMHPIFWHNFRKDSLAMTIRS